MRPIFDTYNDDLHKAITSDNEETAKLFKNNVSRMAAAKSNYTIQLLEACKADVNGVVRSKEEYLKAAKVVVGRANRAQAAEYNTTSHRCRVAKQWARFTEEKRLFPNIQWLRTRSASPRELHLTYVGRIWSMDDSFLVNNTPGCIWNCKCDWKNTDKPVTENSDIVPVPVSPGLEGNPYHTNEVFTDKHPYFSRVEKHIPDVGVLYNADDVAYLNRTTDKGISYQVHYLARNAAETKQNEVIARALANDGFKDVKLLPVINAKEPVLRQRYYGIGYNNKTKCPDCSADGEMLEFKNTTFKNLSRNICEAAKKANTAVIKLEGKADEAWLEHLCRKQFTLSDRANLEKIIIVDSEKVYIYNK